MTASSIAGRRRLRRRESRSRPAAAGRHASAATRRAVVPHHAHRGPRRRGLPVADAPVGRVLGQEHRPDHPGPLAALPGRPGDVRATRARTCRSSTSRCRTARSASSPCSSRCARQSTFIDPAAPDAAPIVWQGSWRTLEPVWQFAPHWENFGEVWDLIDYPRLLFNTIVIAVIVDHRDAALVHARGLRVRPLPVPGPDAPVHAAHRDDLPAGGRDDHPDLHDLPEDRLGRDVAAAARAGVLRQRLRRLPHAPVLHDDPDRDGRGGRDRRRRPVPDADRRSSCRRPGRSSSPSRSSTSSTRGTTSSGRCCTRPGNVDLQTVALGLQRFNGIHYREPGLIQAGTLMTLVIPVIAFLLTQRFFTRGIVITGVDK